MSRKPDVFERLLGPRPGVTFVIADQMVREIWVAGRAPRITIRDYDWGQTDLHPYYDRDGAPFTPINWKGPAWKLGLSLHPPKEEDYPMAQTTLKTIPIETLHVSKLNMRHGRKAPDVSDILPSIKDKGIRQTLLVRPEGDGYGVVAGRRRLFALRAIAEESGQSIRVPCAIMEADDDAAAVEASLIENIARLPATEMEQYVAFGKLAKVGRAPDDIAAHFGVTTQKVNRILALANLTAPIRALYAKDEIDAQTIRALTLATKKQQADWLALFKSETQRAPMGRWCKEWITGGDTITTDKALFDLETYEGKIIADLFGEHGVFASSEAFWQAQSAAIAAQLETYLEAGWSDVQVLERGSYFHTWEHMERPRKKRGKVFVEVRHDGSVAFYEGYLTRSDAKRLEQAASGEADAPKAVKPEMSGPLARYISEHRRGAASASLLAHPSIALRLMVAHALVGSQLWTVRRHDFYTKKDDVMASLDGSRAAQEMADAKSKTDALFEAHGLPSVRANGDAYHLCQVFAALLGMNDNEVIQILTLTMAETLESGGATVEAVAVSTQTDMSAYWSPEPVFFDLVRSKPVINAMLCDIATPAAAKSCLTETGKVQKQLIANRIAGEGCAPNPDWRPAWVQVPPRRYIKGAGSPPADAWAKIAGLFSDGAENVGEGEDAAYIEDKAA